MCEIIEYSQKTTYQAVNTTLIHRNWLLSYRIASEELQGEDRAKYGAEIIKKLSKELSVEYVKYIRNQIYIVFILFTRLILRFSGQRPENLYYYYLGRIMLHYYKLRMRKLVNGMKKKL